MRVSANDVASCLRETIPELTNVDHDAAVRIVRAVVRAMARGVCCVNPGEDLDNPSTCKCRCHTHGYEAASDARTKDGG